MNGLLYDLIIWPAERHTLAPMREGLLAPLRGRVIEVGTGTGANLNHYAAGAEVIALEPDIAMLRRAQTRVKTAAARVSLVQADASYLDTLADASVDAVVFALVLCTIPDPQSALLSAKRVLKPSGMLVVMEHIRTEKIGRLQDALTPAWGLVAGGCHLNRSTRQNIEDAGFAWRQLVIKRVPGIIIREILYGYAARS